jgi:hypothetical protein
LLQDAERRIEEVQRDSRFPAFVTTDFERAYGILRTLAEAYFLRGRLFCEWGSGLGVVACLAAMLDFDACGIEIEWELVDAARSLADDFGLPVRFVRGSFIPRGSAAMVNAGDRLAWLSTDIDGGLEELGLAPAAFDVIFAYPWPDEDELVGTLFEQHAAAGSVLLTYHGGEKFRLRRKTRQLHRQPRKTRQSRGDSGLRTCQ